MRLPGSSTLIPVIILLSFCGCKKVIDVNLKNVPSQTVITGTITNKPGPYQVKITKTVNFTSDNNFPGVSGAFVTITHNNFKDTLTETSPGIYSTHGLRGMPGGSYALYVSVDDRVYRAASVMPQPVHLDSIGLVSGINDDLFPVAYFQDPEGTHNYYQFVEYINGKKLINSRGNAVFDDRLSNGRYISSILYDDSTNMKSGDTLSLEMNCIDEPVYNYLNELLQISGGGGFSSPAPANPTSNISGGVLGYFTANTVTERSIIVP